MQRSIIVSGERRGVRRAWTLENTSGLRLDARHPEISMRVRLVPADDDKRIAGRDRGREAGEETMRYLAAKLTCPKFARHGTNKSYMTHRSYSQIRPRR